LLKKAPLNIWIVALILFVISLLFQVEQDIFNINTLAYHRTTFLMQWWQCITANLVHANWIHWLLNILNFFALIILFGYALNGIELIIFFTFSSIFIICCIYLYSNPVTSYVGASGVLYSLAVYGSIVTFKYNKIVSSLVLIYVAIKLFAHNWINSIMGVDTLLGDLHIITDAHLYGIIFGVIFGVTRVIKEAL